MEWKRTPMISIAATVTAGVLAAALVGAAGPTSAGAATTVPLPERLSNLGDARQVVVVTTPGWESSYARLQTWRMTASGEWARSMDPVRARVGWNGVRREANRLQNTGTTPAGTFELLRAFGTGSPSGVSLPYRRIDRNDYWPYDPSDPKTYNVLQPWRVKHAKWRKAWAEQLISYDRQYRYSVVLNYNLPSDLRWRNGQRIALNPANTSKGGGIFLHVNGSGATAGCISISRSRMLRVLRWLDPTKDPVIVIGPSDVIDRM